MLTLSLPKPLFSTMSFLLIASATCGLQQAAAASIALPELLYYRFNEGSGTTTANLASPGAGANPATLNGLSFNATGASGSSLGGNGGASGTNYLDTGWATSLGSGDWTIATWMSPSPGASGILNYYFGDLGASSLRAFTNGVAGANNLIFRGPFTDVLVQGLSTVNNNHVAFVYSSSAGNIKGYLNGALVVTVNQAAINIPLGSTFKVGGYSNSVGIQAGGWLDEFQVFSRALDGDGVVSAMNADFIGLNNSPVPEPSTFALFSLAAGVGAIAARRRRS